MDTTALMNMAVAQLGPALPTAQNIMRIGVTLAQEANKATDLPGRAKLDLVIHALRDLLAVPSVAERLTPEMTVSLRALVDTVIPETISLVVEASRGAFSLKKPSVGCLAGFAALLCRQVAAHGPANMSHMANQAAKMADQIAGDEKEPGVATMTSAAKDTVELTLRSISEPSDAPNPDSA